MGYTPEHMLAVDPGTRKCGLAYFHRGVLREATTLHNPTPAAVRQWLVAHKVPLTDTRWVRERMYFYPERPATHHNLVAVEAWAEALAADFGVRWAGSWDAPTWKGPVPKAPHHERLRTSLTQEGEQWVWDHAHTGEDGRDAVGIGLFALRRVAKGGLSTKPRAPATQEGGDV